jgi:N-acetylglutamate synthase-like GNAT family acetyltransferase
MMDLRPLLSFIGLFKSKYKHMTDGFVFENQAGEIIATTHVSPAGNYWEIAMVATRKDYRRRGLARKLVTTAIEHAKAHGADMCVLEVLQENDPAFLLYKDLGFVHFDTKLKLKLEPSETPNLTPITTPKGYKLLKLDRNKKVQQEKFDLEKRVTPDPVQKFLPVDRAKYFKPISIRIIRPLAKKILKIDSHEWGIYWGNQLVAHTQLFLAKNERNVHRCDIMIDLDHIGLLSNIFVTKILSIISEHSEYEVSIVLEQRAADKSLIKVLQEHNFVVYETDKIMGLKL